MNKTIFDFKFLDMRVSAARSALWGSLILLVIATAAAVFLTELTPLDSLIAGILATILHWLAEILHQYGHFLAAKAVKNPMTGLRLWWILGTSLYPQNEANLLPQIHIRRALGGPVMSFAILVLFVILWMLFASQGGMLQFLLGWVILEHLVIFVGGALLPPLNFSGFANDGGTILHWWRQQNQNR